MRCLVIFLSILLSAAPANAATPKEQLRTLQEQAMAAHKAGYFAECAKNFAAALAIRPHHPRLLYNFAACSAKAGNASGAIRALNEYADMGLIADVEKDGDFDGIKDQPPFKAVLAKFAANGRPIGTSSTLMAIGGAPFLAEGIAFDSDGKRFFVSSVDQRKVVQFSETGPTSNFVATGRDGLLGAFGMAVDGKRHFLWVAVSGLPHAQGLQTTERGAIGVFAYSLRDGSLTRRAFWHPDREGVVGDLIWDKLHDTIYATDSVAPRVYTLSPSDANSQPSVWLESDEFGSLQGIATTPLGNGLIVADYARGLHFINRRTKAIKTIAFAGGTTLLGIDGLYRLGDIVVAVQNGVNPQRIIAFKLTTDRGTAERIADQDDKTDFDISQVKVLSANDPNIPEPALGLISDDGNKFCVVANAQWSRFNDDGTRAKGAPLDAPRIACIGLFEMHK